MVSKIDHLGVLVEDIEANRELFELLGLEIGAIEHVPTFDVDIAFIAVSGTLVELVEPVTDDSQLAADLESTRWQALLHHVAYRVEDIDARLTALRESGVALADPAPRRGAGGAKVAFLDRRAANGVRIELVERDGGTQFPGSDHGCGRP